MKATTTADVVLEKLKQIEREHEEKLAAWDAERNAATAARRYFGRPQPCGRTPRVAELAERLGISRAGLNALLKPLLAEHRVEVYKRVGAHDGIASVKDDTRDRALAVDARRREIAVLRTMAEDWVKAHEYNPIFNVEVRMDRDEKGEPLPGRVLLEITTSCSDENMISLLEVVKSVGEKRMKLGGIGLSFPLPDGPTITSFAAPRTCGKCGATVPDNGPCPACQSKGDER